MCEASQVRNSAKVKNNPEMTIFVKRMCCPRLNSFDSFCYSKLTVNSPLGMLISGLNRHCFQFSLVIPGSPSSPRGPIFPLSPCSPFNPRDPPDPPTPRSPLFPGDPFNPFRPLAPDSPGPRSPMFQQRQALDRPSRHSTNPEG